MNSKIEELDKQIQSLASQLNEAMGMISTLVKLYNEFYQEHEPTIQSHDRRIDRLMVAHNKVEQRVTEMESAQVKTSTSHIAPTPSDKTVTQAEKEISNLISKLDHMQTSIK